MRNLFKLEEPVLCVTIFLSREWVSSVRSTMKYSNLMLSYIFDDITNDNAMNNFSTKFRSYS